MTNIAAHDEQTTLYCIPMMFESQIKPLDDHCFGDCGKISMAGAIDIDEVGPCWVCTQAECQYEKGHTEIIGTSQMTGDPVCIRGLEPQQQNSPAGVT